MKKILALIKMELFFSVRRLNFVIYYSVLFLLTSLFFQIMCGIIPSVEVSNDSFKMNGPQLVDGYLSIMMMVTTFIVATFAGGGAMRDYRYNSHEITFSYPISKSQYILGKFGGVYLTNVLLFTAPIIAHMVTCFAPWLNRELFVDFTFTTYLNLFLYKYIINLFFLSVVFFALGLMVRNVVVNWVAIILLFVLYIITNQLFGKTDTRTLAALLDPYGIWATNVVNVGISREQANTQQIPFTGLLVVNRIIWLSTGLLLLLFTLWRFQFSYQALQLKFRKKLSTDVRPASRSLALPVPKTAANYGFAFYKSVFFNQLKLECRQIFRNIYFYLIAAIAVAVLIVVSFFVGETLETPGYPTTIRVVETFTGSMGIFMLLIIMVFSGEVVWRDQQYKLDGITGSTPAPQLVRLAAKTMAVFVPVVLMYGVIMFTGLLTQAANGYYQFDLALYVKYLFGYDMVEYIYYCILAVGLQSFVKGKYIGYFLFALVYIFFNFFGMNVFETGLLVPGHFPDVDYSDITGFQNSFYPFYVYAVYWILFAILIWRIGAKLWIMSGEQNWKTRWNSLLVDVARKRSIATLLLTAGFLAIGGFIYYNTHVLNESHNVTYYNKLKAKFEKDYGYLRNVPQLSLTAVNGNLNLFPSDRKMDGLITLTLTNKNEVPVNKIYLNLTNHEYYKNWTPNVGWKQISKDDDLNFYGYQFAQPVQPGQSITLKYNYDYKTRGFTDNGASSVVNKNGTFINNQYFLPGIGYDPSGELEGNLLRKKYGLGPKPYTLDQDDPIGRNQNMLGIGSDRIALEMTISTEEGQTAISPGYLQKKETKNGRTYFTYAMDQPAVNYFSIQSGKYEVQTRQVILKNDSVEKPVALSVYYHKDHAYNIKLMMECMEDALSYYSSQFSMYQYRQCRIIEFPSASFAQSFANTIPFSENIGFLADLRDTATKNKEKQPADVVYYVTAHEVAHQWWAHQILPANTEGANFLCETMAQYSAAMLMKHKYGEERVRKFIEMESFKYMQGRSSEGKEERPLANVMMDQQYIFYNKGTCMMYALQDYLGEETVNKVIRNFIRDYAFKERPYVTSNVFISRLKEAAPDSLKYLVSDCLEKIIVYANEIKSATTKQNPDNSQVITATILGKKLNYTLKGKESEVAMNDYVMIGFYDKDDHLVSTQKVKLKSGQQSVHFTVTKNVTQLMLNPNFDLQEKLYMRGKVAVEVGKRVVKK